MIERKNIIKLLSERTKANVYHSAVLTCYNFDPIFFETVYLPSLRTLGITNVIVMMDAGMYDNMLADSLYACHKVSAINYTLVRQENKHQGVFHPKMTLLFGEEEGAIIVGSGNLTFSGLSNNEEVWNAFHVVGDKSIHYPLLYKSWTYVQDVLSDASSLVKKQLGWITEQSLWLQEGATQDIITLQSGEECSLLYNGISSRILDKVAESIGDAIVEEITVVAPFYDTEGNALRELMSHYNPKLMNCVLDISRQSAPYDLLNSVTNIKFHKHTADNPLHAKIFEFKTNRGTWLLSGSANAGNMALGLNSNVFNDEACILLHSLTPKNYIKELGVQYAELKDEERKAIERPKQPTLEPSTILTRLKSCEVKEGKIYLQFSHAGIDGVATILDKNQNVIFEEIITTTDVVRLVLDDEFIAQAHIAVLVSNGESISNRCLIIKELNIESCNPDPKRRKLSSLLDDTGLLSNLTHILGYIEFDEDDKKSKSGRMVMKSTSSKDKEDIVVTKDRFDELKDSSLSISMHSGVRILTYLQQILFKKEESEKSDDDLLEIDKEENSNNEDNAPQYVDNKTEISSIAEDANKMRSEIANFLKKMQQHLLETTQDKSIHGKVNPAVNKPQLMAIPGLNASSAMAVAARSVVVMMNKYGSNVMKLADIWYSLVMCARLFCSIYANGIPSDDSNRSKKTRELIKDATVDLLAALSFFGLGHNNTSLPLVVLNSFDLWKGTEELSQILPLYEELLSKLNIDNLYPRTIERISTIAKTYLSGDAPIQEFDSNDSFVYQYRSGFGFLLVDNIKKTPIGWSFSTHASWFEDHVITNGTKYKGYSIL